MPLERREALMAALFLSASQVSRVRDVVDLCRPQPQDAEAASWAVLDALQQVVGCDAVMLNAVDAPRRGHYYRQWWADGEQERDASPGPELDNPFWSFYEGCAPCVYPDHVGGRALVSQDRFYTVAEWREHPMHREVLQDVVDEVVMTFPDGEGRTIRYLFARTTGRRFGESELVLLSLLAPHLEALALTVRTPPSVGADMLTPRQKEILELVRLGLANKQIARELGVSSDTVRKHLENIYHRLDVQSRGAAVHAAVMSPTPTRNLVQQRG